MPRAMSTSQHNENRLWPRLRTATPARIGLLRAGPAIATRDHLAFQVAHAAARDAVNSALDPMPLLEGLCLRGLEAVHLQSAACDRHTYLARPDLGRRLDALSRDRLGMMSRKHEVMFVLADGLSARAISSHVLPVLDRVLPGFRNDRRQVGPVAVVERGRVAIGDEIGEVLDTDLVIVFIGERPGLSSPDSLGIYLTWAPKIGRVDAQRNCLSNIRPEGMSYSEAAQRLLYLSTQARLRKLTGVLLKDNTQIDSGLID